MNPTSFSDSVDVSVTVIFNIIKGRRSKPSFELLHKILTAYGKLNAEWLIKGEGPMWNDDVVSTEQIAPTQVNVEMRIRELFTKLRITRPDMHELFELEDLVNFMMIESQAQKQRLVVLHDRQEGIIKMLKEKLKLKKKALI